MARHQRITTLRDNGPPPQAAGTLYPGEVMHARLKPFGHRFVYSVFSLLVDIDRLDELGRASPLLSVNSSGIFSFWEKDHIERDEETVRGYADRLLTGAGLERPARILLLCYPRLFGYTFNPISVYFAYDADGTLTALVYAVRNTFGERHSYVAPIRPGDLTEAGVRQTRAKIFHVSPFIGMDARYHFRVMPPGETVKLRIHETEGCDPVLSATFAGTAKVLGTGNLLLCLLKFPLMTWKIMAGIHWEALKLWLKGARFHKSPAPPATVSHRDARCVEPGE
ncbi:DUF1365 domain-containing protein [Oryzicola mucosus]|uniref:DUF1365 domain-containing protein n=1 Tax=Oryzicola mucosus TaxID=2767425 RepID=A0A8J6TYN2_9HYPH|nr:DUF1365 domain-containing protein [Oryzicola mucosus]MBD0415029.1 DUF1365 domain-containing protein [Oryzicola mucosus]